MSRIVISVLFCSFHSLPRKRKLNPNEKELTVNMPAGNKMEGKSSKPVKLKRNSYDPGRDNSQENDKVK